MYILLKIQLYSGVKQTVRPMSKGRTMDARANIDNSINIKYNQLALSIQDRPPPPPSSPCLSTTMSPLYLAVVTHII